MPMHNPYQLLTSAQLPEFFTHTLPAFWQQHAQCGELEGVGALPLRYAALRQPVADKAILLVSGRIESYIKYQELAFELYRLGYSVYLCDHRGQGLSARLLSDPHKGHVQHFADYVSDLARFQQQVVAADGPQRLYLLAHSMGGTIALHYLRQHGSQIRAAALSSPMLGIQMGRWPQWLAKAVLTLLSHGARVLRREPPYAPGTGPYHAIPFNDNELSRDPRRYAEFRRLYAQHDAVQLGGPSVRWLQQALIAMQQAYRHAHQLTTPLLLLSASDDQVVSNAHIAAFCARAAAAGVPCDPQPLTIAGARHELLNERDECRIPALTAILDFFERNQ